MDQLDLPLLERQPMAGRREVWPETYRQLCSRDPADLTPDQLEDLAESAWLVCRLAESLSVRQQVYVRYHEIHDDRPAAEALYALAEIRRRRGDLAAAEHSYLQAHELGRDPQPGLALVRLAQ